MRVAVLCTVLGGLWGIVSPVAAAPGDTLFIQGDGVNIRQKPSTESPVMQQLDRGRLLVELRREGDWVNVGLDGTDGFVGWVHGTLVSPEAPAGAAAVPSDPRFEGFRREVLALNAKAYGTTGANHFTGASDLGDGIVRVIATEAWLAKPQDARHKDMDALFDLWDAAEGTGLPILVQVVDRGGNVVLTRARR
jgi:hypothetical protein